MKQVLSKLYSLGKKDWVRSLFMAFAGSILTAIYSIIQSGGSLPSGGQWKNILLVGLGAAVSYLIKNFFTNSNNQMFAGEPKK